MSIILYYLILASVSRAASPPILNRPLVSQLFPDNPAISSMFLVSSSSALVFNDSISLPALRVPPSWSFSVGFSGATFLPAPYGSQLLSFDAELDNGNPLPSWLQFSPDTITFGGVAPKQSNVRVCNIVVTATDKYSSSSSDKFTLIVSPHDLSLSGPLLTRNVTAATKFTLVIDDWGGVLVDGAPVHPHSMDNTTAMTPATWNNMTLPLVLDLNTASFNWLSYDPTSRTLTGTPPLSYIGAPGPTIPALVTLAFPPQFLTVSTNLTLDVFPSAFTVDSLPPILAPPETQLAFSLAPFLSSGAISNFNVSLQTDPLNATWLKFDVGENILRGTVPAEAPPNVKVFFTARSAASGVVSHAEMLININPDSGNGGARTPTDRALRKASKTVGLAVGLVCGILAAIILLAGFLAICRRCCAARECVDGAYVVRHSAFHEGLKTGGAYEKEARGDTVNVYLATPPRIAVSPVATEGRMITKTSFFSAVRERFRSDGSWRGRRTPNSGVNPIGNERRTRKSKISKPMAVLSSSTSVRDGFADRARGDLDRPNFNGANFSTFGSRTNAQGSTGSASPPGSSAAPLRRPLPDISLPERVLVPRPVFSGDTAAFPHDRSRSNSDPSQNPAPPVGSNSARAPRSGSAPSIGMDSHSLGTLTGTQSTFTTGDSTRLTNAAGEVPLRRPGFDGRCETLGERSAREMGTPGMGHSPAPIFPSRALLKASGGHLTPKSLQNATTTHPTISESKVASNPTPDSDRPAKSPGPANYITPPEFSKSNSPANATAFCNKKSFLKVGTSASSQPIPPLHPSASAKSAPPNSSASSLTHSQTGSERGLPILSSYGNVFGNKDYESDGVDSSAEDIENAVIRRAVSNETLAKQGPMGKPRLVAFTHARTPAASDQVLRRDVSQRVVLQGREESDPEAEMRMGLEYVRQLGHPDSKQEQPRTNNEANSVGPSAKFYASNDSNGSITGRSRVVSYLKINSDRHRHQTAYSTEGMHESLVSSAEREGRSETEIRWMVEAELPRVLIGAGEWFEFAAPLDRTHKHTSAPAGSALEAKQADGRALPEWLRFKKGDRQFWGVAPEAAKGESRGALVTRVVVNIWESEKSQVVGGCVVDVVEDELRG